MAAPSAPTVTTLTTEALKRCGESSPSSAQLTRAADWMEEIKNDIWRRCKTLKSLQTVSALVITQGRSRYSMPTDYAGAGEVSMRLIQGGRTGSLQTAAAGSATLAASESATAEYVQGKEIFITSGTGINQISQAYSYNAGTKVASVSPTWGTTPATSDGYMIIENYYPLGQGPIWDYDKLPSPHLLSRPDTYHPAGDNDYSEFYLSPCPDATYGALIRYYANLMTADLSGTLVSTLYQKYRNVWIFGTQWRFLENEDDNRATGKKVEYLNALSEMIASESYGNTLSELQQRCSE